MIFNTARELMVFTLHVAQMAVGYKKFIFIAIKFAISGALLYWALRTTSIPEILNSVRSADIEFWMAAFVLYATHYYLRAARWRILLSVQGGNATTSYLIRSYIVSVFFSNFLPSTIGGDAVRVYDSWKNGINKTAAVVVLFVDRFLGMLALMILSIGALLVPNAITRDLSFLFYWALTGMAIIFFITWMIFLPSSRLIDFITKIRLLFPQKLQVMAAKAFEPFQAFRGRADILSSAMGLSLFSQVIVVIHYILIAKALQLPIPFHNFFIIVPLAIFIIMFPVSINAIGLRENVFIFFFSTFSISQSDSVAFAWLVYAVVLLLGVLGGFVYIIRR